MAWNELALWWLPTIAVTAMALLAFVEAQALAWAAPPRPGWRIRVLLCGAIAIAATVWQQRATRTELADSADQLHELSSQLAEIGRLLPAGPDAAPADTFDTVAAAIVSLGARVKDLDSQIAALKEKYQSRTIEAETADRMAEFLRPLARTRVVISCVPSDVEAYNYANQLANVLRAAGWQALGPETTTIFGEAPGMGVNLFVRAGAAPDAAKSLIDAFARFNIPYQSRIAPTDAIPDPVTIELFVAPKA